MELTRRQKISLIIFFGALAAMVALVAGVIVYDAWVHNAHPGGTISEGMAILGHVQPIVPFALGLGVGLGAGLSVGLAFHFWWGMDRPAVAAEREALRAEVAAWRTRYPWAVAEVRKAATPRCEGA